MRIIRDIDFHGKNIDELSSFALGLTQDLEAGFASLIVKYKVVDESLSDRTICGRSKHKHEINSVEKEKRCRNWIFKKEEGI